MQQISEKCLNSSAFKQTCHMNIMLHALVLYHPFIQIYSL